NILLDQDFCPKISDFGLAQLCLRKDSIFSAIDTRGTIGYIAPEVFSRNFGVVSSKSDVYSYGMMILEMVGVRNTSPSCNKSDSEYYFPNWIYEHYNQIGHMKGFSITIESEEIAKKMILVGLWCIQTNPGSRPSMSRVVDMLQCSIDDLEMPPKPTLFSS
ncbi:LEAF RUST 10 DISEASE-RESISTANCE LOCUS RECEPTOR-LIKE PROTEIN KINASE-like 2.3, partial [Dendrobium catenatum]